MNPVKDYQLVKWCSKKKAGQHYTWRSICWGIREKESENIWVQTYNLSRSRAKSKTQGAAILSLRTGITQSEGEINESRSQMERPRSVCPSSILSSPTCSSWNTWRMKANDSCDLGVLVISLIFNVPRQEDEARRPLTLPSLLASQMESSMFLLIQWNIDLDWTFTVPRGWILM